MEVRKRFRQSLRSRIMSRIGHELGQSAQFFDAVVFIEPHEVTEAGGSPFDHFSSPRKLRVRSLDEACTTIETLVAEGVDPILVVPHTTANYSTDFEAELSQLCEVLPRSARLGLVAWSPYLRSLYLLVDRLGLREHPLPTTFLTDADLTDLAKLAGLEVCRRRSAAWVIPPYGPLADLAQRLLPVVPFGEVLALTNVYHLRPVAASTDRPSLSVVIPARNERGNIQGAIDRLESWDRCELEILFVEGHSNDGTWEEIERAIAAYTGQHRIRAFRQTGKGKADAVRLGFGHATSELLTIIDADLTMPPELLHRFYDAYVEGHADFVNGSRLVYPMEDDSMRTLNRFGNVFFAKALSYVLDAHFGDVLCGTKLLRRRDYERMVQWRAHFGDFDPFGDFELLFPAAVLGLGCIDVPIRYRARVYGETNISRFRHGAQLLKMVSIGLARIKLGP